MNRPHAAACRRPSPVLIGLTLCLMAPPLAAEHMVDLAHPFDERTIYWPTEPGFVLRRGPSGVTDRGYFYAANRFSAPEHGGTHLDAPFHFAEQGQTVDQIPLARLVGAGVCVDVTRQCTADRDYQVTIDDLLAWERAHEASLTGKIVLLRTGFARHWPDRKQYLGTQETGRAAVSELRFPGLHPTAAQWLAVKRRIKSVGIDTASIDYGASEDFGSHVALFQHNVPALENLAALDGLPPTGFRVVALPMKIAGGSGAPCRVIAIVGE